MRLILIVDDSQSDRQLAAQVVKSMGDTPVFANDGEDALTKVKENDVSLVLMDIVMPGTDGFAACRKMKKDPETKDIPIIMISSKDGSSDKVWAKRQGAADYLVKPYTPQTLQAAIQAQVG